MPEHVNIPYKWEKVYAVRTSDDDDVKEGAEVEVDDSNGGSIQKVLSVTTMYTKGGRPYKVLLLREIRRLSARELAERLHPAERPEYVQGLNLNTGPDPS